MYSSVNQITLPETSDQLFPLLALNHFSLLVGIFFLLGITASSYASADSALAGLTTSFCIDFLNFSSKTEDVKRRQKFMVHIGFSVLFLAIILLFKEINQKSVIDAVLKAAGYTYGPLLGLFGYGLLSRRHAGGPAVLIVCIAAPVISYVISSFAPVWFNGYRIDIEILVINGLLTMAGLHLISTSEKKV
jgi:Na+/proline symporter